MTTLANMRKLQHENNPANMRRLAAEYRRLGSENMARLADAVALQYERGPVEVLDINIEWCERYANPPRLNVRVSRLPQNDEWIFTQHHEITGLHYAEVHGMCQFYSYVRPDRGYGGARFKILMANGEEKTLIGPWSSGSYAMNQHGFGPCMEIGVTDKPEVIAKAKGHTYYGGAITIEKILPALQAKGYGLVLMQSNTYEITSRAKYPDRKYHAKSCKPGSMGSFCTVKEVVLEPTD